jgi:hypothetical protein
LNYGSNEDVKIALTIKYDNAIQAPTGQSLGQAMATGIAGALGF